MVKRNIIVLRVFLLLCISLGSIYSSFSQEVDTKPESAKNEVNANIAYVLRGYVSVSYERQLYQNFSLGIDVGTSIADFDLDVKYSLGPYVRAYFPTKKRSLFFIEVIGAFINYEEIVFFTPNFSDLSTGTAEGFGTAIGWKLVGKNNFTFNVVLGGIANYELSLIHI